MFYLQGLSFFSAVQFINKNKLLKIDLRLELVARLENVGWKERIGLGGENKFERRE